MAKRHEEAVLNAKSLNIFKEAMPIGRQTLMPAGQWILNLFRFRSFCLRDLNNWNLGRVVWVMDRGMSSEKNQRFFTACQWPVHPG